MTQIDEVQKLKVERMLDVLDEAEGSNSSMISLLVPSGGDLNKIKHLLTEEYTAATNVQSRL
jgi:peptide subunit release factor 1 (eRF1)